jgi:competence protein ComEC
VTGRVVDLRLACAALVCWAAAWWVTGGPGPGRALVWGTAGLAVAAAALVTATLAAAAVRAVPAAARPVAARREPWPGRAVRSGAPACALAVGAGALLLLAASAQLAARDAAGLAQAASSGAVVTVEGRVRDDPQVLASAWGGDPLVLVSVDADVVARGDRAVRAAVPVLVRGNASWTGARVGERLLVTGRLRPADPGEREAAQLTPIRAPDRIDGPHGPVAAADRLRADLMATTDDLSPQARALVPGVAIGDVSRLDPDLSQAMKTVGLTHVTAVSGGHFAIVVAALTAACSTLRLRRWARLGVLAPTTAAFVLLVRPDPSVVRSAAMCAFALVALALGRPSRALPALAASVVVLLVADPWLARSFGFVLSACATAGIVLGAGPLARRLSAWIPRPLALAVAVPTVAQAACGPVLVLLAPAVSVYAVPANLVAEPALVPATVLGVLATLVAPWWAGGAHVLATVAGWATWWIASTATLFAGLPGARLAWAPGGAGAVLLLVATAAAAVALWNWRWAARAARVRIPWERGAGWSGPSPWARRGRLRTCLQRLVGPPVRRPTAGSSRSRTSLSPP